MAVIRVAVVADDPLSGDGAAHALRSRIEVEILPAERRGDADVVLAVTVGAGADVVGLLGKLASDGPPPRVVLIADSVPEFQMMRAVELGLVSVVARREATPTRVVQAVLGATRRRAEMPGDLLCGLLDQVRVLQRDVLGPLGLTTGGLQNREVDVLRLLAEGFDTQEIGEKLSYSERTVKNILHGMMSRLHLRNRSHAVAFGMRCGVV